MKKMSVSKSFTLLGRILGKSISMDTLKTLWTSFLSDMVLNPFIRQWRAYTSQNFFMRNKCFCLRLYFDMLETSNIPNGFLWYTQFDQGSIHFIGYERKPFSLWPRRPNVFVCYLPNAMEAPSKFLVCQYIYVYTGFLRSLEKYEKNWSFSSLENLETIIFWSVSMETENCSGWSFDMHF